MLSYLPADDNFLSIPPEHSTERARIVIHPVPYERTTSYGKGTKDGPRDILRASHFVEFYDDEYERELCFEVGIATVEPLPLKKLPITESLALIEARTRAIIGTGKFCLSLGGEHTISLPIIRAHLEQYPGLSILHFDAHADLRDEYEGNPYSHACVMARLAQFISPNRITQVGIRALCKEEAEIIKVRGIRTFFASAMRRLYPTTDWLTQLVEGLTDQVYITFDVDALDPSIMPATGTPEPDGLTYSECIEIIRGVVSSGRRIVGIDVVEFAPIKKIHHASLTAARLAYKLLNIAFSHESATNSKRTARSRRTARA